MSDVMPFKGDAPPQIEKARKMVRKKIDMSKVMSEEEYNRRHPKKVEEEEPRQKARSYGQIKRDLWNEDMEFMRIHSPAQYEHQKEVNKILAGFKIMEALKNKKYFREKREEKEAEAETKRFLDKYLNNPHRLAAAKETEEAKAKGPEAYNALIRKRLDAHRATRDAQKAAKKAQIEAREKEQAK